MVPTPPAEVWLQFAIVAVCVLVIGLFLVAIGIGGRYLLNWIDKRDQVQREWQECMAKARDEEQAKRYAHWQEYLTLSQNHQTGTLRELVTAVQDMRKSMDLHGQTLMQHDTRAEQFIDETRSSLARLTIIPAGRMR